MRVVMFVFMALTLLTLFGCDQPATTGGGSTPLPMSIDESAAGTLSPAEVNLTVVDGPLYAAVLEKHQGSVLLVDYWATWCPPCQEKFPHIVELHGEHADDGLVVVSLSIDYPEDEPAVRAFLASQSATFENLLSKFGASEQSAEALDFDGGIPLYKLYDRTGELRYQFGEFPDELAGGEPIENIDRRVEELLNEVTTEEPPTNHANGRE